MNKTPSISIRNVHYALDCARLGLPAIRECGFLNLRSPSPLTEHRNDGFEITLAASGQAHWEIVSKGQTPATLHLHGGQFSLMQPRLPHRGGMDIIEPVDLLYVVLNLRTSRSRQNLPLSASEITETRRLLAHGGNSVYPATSEMLSLYARLKVPLARFANGDTDPLLPPAIRCLLVQFVLEVAATVRTSVVRPEVSEASLARSIREFVLNHITEPLTVERLAANCGLRRSQFSQVFRKTTGFSPADFVARTRCQHAADLLRRTDESVTHIAHRCGFSSSQYMARCFGKYLNKTPREFRLTRI